MGEEKICFIISPIGEKDSETRKLADQKYDLIFEPVLIKLGYKPIRADKENSPNSISRTIVTRLINSELVIADTSEYNANVFYELAIRNAVKKPVIAIKAPEQKLPFDVFDKRAITINMNDNYQWTEAKEELRQHIKNAEDDPTSASESILSEYTFDLSIGNTPNTDQELILLVKDLKDEVRNLRGDVKNQNNFTPIIEETNSIFSLKEFVLAQKDSLAITIKPDILGFSDKVKTIILNPKGEQVFEREQKVNPKIVGFGFPVSSFAKDKGLYSVNIYLNGAIVDSFAFVVE